MDSVLKFLIKFNADDGNLFSATRRVTEQLNRVEYTARQAGRAIRNAFSLSSFRSALMDIPGMRLLSNPYMLVAGGIGAIAKIGAEAEMTAKAFDVLVGSQEASAALMQKLTVFANDTPFGKMEILQNAQALMAMTVEADKVEGYLRRLGDIAMGDSQKLQALSLVFGQVKAAGSLNGGDLRQFINVGFNPLKELQDMTGKSYDELQELMSQGRITFDNVALAIERATNKGGKFYDMTNQLAKTTQGQLGAAVGNLQEMAIGLYQSLQPYILGLVKGLNRAIPIISSALGGLFNLLTSGIEFVREWKDELLLVGGIIIAVALGVQAKTIAVATYQGVVMAVTAVTKGWSVMQAMLNTVLTANPIGVVIMLIGALIVVGVYCWNKFAGFRAFMLTMWDVFKGFGDIIKDYVIDRIQSLLSGIGKLGEAIKLFFTGNWDAASSKAKEAVIDLSGYSAVKSAALKTKELTQNSWRKNLEEQSAKDGAASSASLQDIINGGISTPGLKGSESTEVIFGNGKSGKSGKGGKSGEAIATGGTRNTQITMTIGKLIETINVSMMDKTDSADLERVVLQSINRSLAIATSTDR